MKEKIVFFATGNIHKFNEARIVLVEHGLVAAMIREKTIEIQSDSLLAIASASALEAFKHCHLPLIVEDAGLFVDALNGFPGPYAAYAYKTIENGGLLKLMENVSDRRATFRSAIAYCNNEKEIICFEGETTGSIALAEQTKDSKSAFGFDPIFRPQGSDKTFTEMGMKEKNKVSHRARAINKFAEWYKKSICP
jgi:XTP/dITP diphosphohydrolase